MTDERKALPENAYRELKPDEIYTPVIPDERGVLEVTVRSVLFGLAMGVLFSAAAAYIALKLGQGIESAIPISILAIGFSALLARKSSLLENINILAIGATSGILVGGSVFTMPAIFVLGLEDRTSFFQIFIVPFLGACLGVLFLIPFRRYFVAEMHGKLPYPEGTAITEILMTGERGGQQAKVLVSAMGIGFVFDLVALTFTAWRDIFTTSLIRALDPLTHKVKAVFALNTSAAVLGLGYIIGVRYASIICAGSFLAYFVLVPLVAWVGANVPGIIGGGSAPISQLGAEDLFFDYVRFIGIGGIFAAGIISIIKMSPVMAQALGKAFAELRKLLSGGLHSEDRRTDSDIPMGLVVILTAVVAVLIWLYFRLSAWAVAMISVTPISGMTLTTLIVSAVVLAKLGLTGPDGMLATLLIGGVVCTALSMTGSLVTEFKISYWLGATPRRVQWSNILAAAVASITVTAAIMLFASTKGYVVSAAHPNPMPAPQANAMAAVIQSVMASAEAPWLLYGVGAVIALIVEMLGISALAFALGMYLPIELNTPILFGALVAEYVRRRSPSETIRRARNNRGTLIASGLIAGGALAGVADGIASWIADARGSSIPSFGNLGSFGNWLGLLAFCALAVYVIWDASRAREEEGAGPEISI
jgi:uncharacterized oligopeptide transporter (OPT) family protein